MVEESSYLTSRDFQRAASQRLDTAAFLLKNRYNLDAMYLAGYAIECTLKALILELTPDSERVKRLDQIKTHNLEKLGAILKDLGRPIPLELVEKFRKSGWSTGLRYETGRIDTGRTRWYLKTVNQAYNWVEGQLP